MTSLTSEFSGKTVLITGGTEGIGLATARMFAGEGANVVIAARDAQRGARVQAELCGFGSLGGKVLFVPADVGQPGAAEQLVARTVAEFGRLDVAVNNAAADIRIAPTADITEAEFDTSLAVNLKGLWLCMKHEIAAMRHQADGSGGAIVNVASINGLSGTPTASIYSATKHAVIGLTRSAARETIAEGIRINAVCPGATDTPFQHRPHLGLSASEQQARHAHLAQLIPLGRLARPEEIAAGIRWLCSAAASYVVGHALVIDGGLTA